MLNEVLTVASACHSKLLLLSEIDRVQTLMNFSLRSSTQLCELYKCMLSDVCIQVNVHYILLVHFYVT